MASIGEFKAPVFVRLGGKDIEVGLLTVPLLARPDPKNPGLMLVTADLSGFEVSRG